MGGFESPSCGGRMVVVDWVLSKKWLGYQDSNLDSWYQKPESCRWTIPQCLINAHRLTKVVGREGIEPATLGLKVPCSAS